MALSGLTPLAGPASDRTWERIRRAVVDLVVERGYAGTTVEAIVERAGVERAEFDRRFAGKDDCCLRAYEAQLADIDRRVVGAFLSHEAWRDQLRAAAYAAAGYVSDHPREVLFGEIQMREGAEMAQARRDAYLQRLVDLVDAGRAELDDPDSLSRGVAERALGAVYSVLLRRLQGGQGTRAARSTVPELMYIVVRPYVGHEAALEELRIPPPPERREEAADLAPRQARTQRRLEVQRFLAGRYLPGVTERERPGEDSAPGLPRLPPGRHGLSREFVAENQRDRLMAGIIAVVAERGYHDATITQIAAAAGVSRRTFYTYFSSKEECFFATYDMVARHLREAARSAAAEQPSWPERVRAKFAAALEFFAANPDLARFLMIAPPRAGNEIAARFHLAINNALAEVTEGMPPPPAVRAPSQAVQQSLVGGVAALVVRKVETGEGERLPELLPDLLELTLAPYLGREEAARLARS
jgi:AcrR family transcriptional regulator